MILNNDNTQNLSSVKIEVGKMSSNMNISERYLIKLGMSQDFVPNLDNLKLLFFRHLQRIPFGNVNSFIGDDVLIDPEKVASKLLDQGREGYCLEQNRLTAVALQELGYNAFNVLARVYYQHIPKEAPIRTHLITIVQLDDGQLFLFDPGFGGITPAQVLSLDLIGKTQQTPLEPYRFILVNETGLEKNTLTDMTYMLQAYVKDQWINLYALNPERIVAESDIMIANWFISTSPDSLFTQDLIFSIVDEASRVNFRNGKIATYSKNGVIKEQLKTRTEIQEALKTKFKLNVETIPFQKVM